jgi:hypothetical protein
MAVVDVDVLRAAAERAKRYRQDWMLPFGTLEVFHAACSPDVVLGLLDRLARAEAALTEVLDCCDHSWLDSVAVWRETETR